MNPNTVPATPTRFITDAVRRLQIKANPPSAETPVTVERPRTVADRVREREDSAHADEELSRLIQFQPATEPASETGQAPGQASALISAPACLWRTPPKSVPGTPEAPRKPGAKRLRDLPEDEQKALADRVATKARRQGGGY